MFSFVSNVMTPVVLHVVSQFVANIVPFDKPMICMVMLLHAKTSL